MAYRSDSHLDRILDPGPREDTDGDGVAGTDGACVRSETGFELHAEVSPTRRGARGGALW